MNNLKAAFKSSASNQGFVLPIALTMGLMMVLVGVTAVARSQSTRLYSFSRTQTAGGSLIVAEGGIARTLAQLTKANNRVLLTGNYDAINPRTGKTYLGADGILNNGDEENTAVNQWASASGASPCGTPIPSTGTPDMTYDGIIGDGGTYTLKAYRYDNASSTGTLLVEGKRKNSVSLIKAIVTVDSIASDFPGVAALDKMEMIGRNVIGSNGNVYYDPAFSPNPSLTASSAPSDANRSDYLNAIKSGTNDGYTVDNIGGKIVACRLNFTFAYTPQGTNLDTIKDDSSFSGSNGGITHYQAKKIELKDHKIVNVDTTAGAVYIYVSGAVKLQGNAKIRNIRTDGVPPKVGDLRIIISTSDQTQIDEKACIQDAFFYTPQGSFKLDGVSDGCPSSGNTNFDGVLWANEISNNSGSDSGIAVPDDLSSLSDVAGSIGLPATQKFGTVKSWQRQQL